MKRLSRLTALLLAMLMFVSVFAFADGVKQEDLDLETWNELTGGDGDTTTGTSSAPVITTGGEVYTNNAETGETTEAPLYDSEYAVNVAMNAAGAEGETAVSLSQYGKVDLSVAASGCQWQVNIAGQWIDVSGETGSTFSATYAKLQSVFMLNNQGAAQVRCVAADGTVSDVVTIHLDAYAAVAIPETDDELAYSVAPVSSTYSLRNANEGIALADASEVTEYDIIINYSYSDGDKVADPYVATIEAGSDYGVVVNHPVVLGYKATAAEDADWNNGVTFSADSVTINVQDISKSIEVKVVYEPTDVNYTVIHYQQNVTNDEYTIIETETLTGLTDSTVPEVKNTYEGFYALLYEQPTIAADGSTLVEIYYDRNYYLINFDLDNGYGVEPIYARYGAAVEVATVDEDGNALPIKAGYTFKGWSLNGTDIVALPATVPAENRTYKAIWEADATATVTIVFWGENANDEEYSYLDSVDVNVKPGTEFTYSEEGSLICGVSETHTHSADCGYTCNIEEHSHDSECYELICEIEEHTSHSEECYTCNAESHTHSKACYAGVGNQQNVYTGVPNNPTEGYVYDHWAYNKLIYIKGYWYRYSGSTSSGSVAPTTCGKTEVTHTHTEACIGCGKEIHVHTEYSGSCYNKICSVTEHIHSASCGYGCGKTEHEHDSDCYIEGAGLDSNLWVFKNSETVVVAADGSSVVNVYYDRTEKTLTFKYDYSNRRYGSTDTITAKWGEDISEEYIAIADDAGTTFWAAQDSNNGPYTNYFGVMPQTSATYYNRGSSGSNGTMTYYGESLDGEYVSMFSVGGVGGYTVTAEDRYEFEGFTYHHGTSNGSSCSGAAFYYTRNSYNLVFNDGYNDVRTESVKYEAPLSTYASYVPDVPAAYEPGSVTFGGWYLNPERTGAKYDLTTHTMPAANVILYAKWVPVQHKVEFYLDFDAYNADTKIGDTHPDLTVEHGAKVAETIAKPKNGDYKFVGWFYMDGDVEKAFDFANMPITKNMKVYGKWSSDVLKQYFVYFKYEDDEGTVHEIAEPITGYALAGNTKTFEAKAGEELYADYQEGYFPEVKSHSITLDIENEANNVFTFWYVEKEAVPYIVRYVDTEGNELIDQKVVANNRKAVVTEKFEQYNGYMPDAYQKRLILNPAEGEDIKWIELENGTKVHPDNVITFVYVKDEKHAYYRVTHYTEPVEGTEWYEYDSHEYIGEVGLYYTADYLDIDGFEPSKTEYVVDGVVVPADQITEEGAKLTTAGMEINLYYERKPYPYVVNYLEEGTGKVLSTQNTGTGKYGTTVTEEAIDIENYELVGSPTKSITIKIEEGETPTLNIINFYYKEKEATITYVVDGPTDCGTVDLKDADDTTVPEISVNETVKVISGDPYGATAAPSSNAYKFVGWFDEEGTCVSRDLYFDPTKEEDAVWTNVTYTAKFEYNLTKMKVVKDVTGTLHDDDASFIFELTDKDGKLVGTFALQDGDYVIFAGLTVGETYTVTEVTSWSTRYTPTNNGTTITLVADTTTDTSVNVVTIYNGGEGSTQWLDAEGYKENQILPQN